MNPWLKQRSCIDSSSQPHCTLPLPFPPLLSVLYSLPPHLLLSAVGLVVLGWTSRPQTLREESTELYLSCRQSSSVGYGRQLLALSLDGCWIGVSSSSWTCLKWPSCNVLCCFSFDLCLFMEGLPVMCALTAVHVCEWAIASKNVFGVEKAILCLCAHVSVHLYFSWTLCGEVVGGLVGCRSKAFEIQKLAHCERALLFSLSFPSFSLL